MKNSFIKIEKQIARNKNAKGFVENKKVAKQGGEVAGNARKELEQKSGKKVSNSDNFLEISQSKKKRLK